MDRRPRHPRSTHALWRHRPSFLHSASSPYINPFRNPVRRSHDFGEQLIRPPSRTMDPFTFGGLDKHFAAARRPAAPKVSLASRNHIESMDTGLSSVSGASCPIHASDALLSYSTGAQAVIKEILARHSVVRLTLGHNNLGDAGCEELFGFLSSEAGRKHKIAQISLNSNDIGNRGLLAISRYLRDNVSLKELFLQNVSLYLFNLSLSMWATLCVREQGVLLEALDTPRMSRAPRRPKGG